MNPIRYEGDVPIFDTAQIALYGEPDYYGYTNYLVIVNRMEEQPLVAEASIRTRSEMKEVHRYDLFARFKGILLQLLGVRGTEISSEILSLFSKSANGPIWEHVRSTLKKHKLSKLYNRIPSIIQALNLGSIPPVSSFTYHRILNDFKAFHARYTEHTPQSWGRSYFPNLRYMAFKLLQLHNITFPYFVPFLRVKRKLRLLDKIWDELKT